MYVRTLGTSFLGEDYALSAYFGADGHVRLPVDPAPYPADDPRSDFPFRPMVAWLRLADAWLFGADPFGHHLLNLLLHAANSVLVYLLAARLFPRMPFWLANYGAAVSRIGWFPFLLATALGSVPNTAAYVVAGARASSPTSPVFLIAVAAIALPSVAGAVVAWRKRHHLRGK